LVPSFNVTDALLPLVFLIAAFTIDGLALWRLKHGQELIVRGSWLLGVVITIPQLLILPCMLMGSLNVTAGKIGKYPK
jgi:hypothetical protein